MMQLLGYDHIFRQTFGWSDENKMYYTLDGWETQSTYKSRKEVVVMDRMPREIPGSDGNEIGSLGPFKDQHDDRCASNITEGVYVHHIHFKAELYLVLQNVLVNLMLWFHLV